MEVKVEGGDDFANASYSKICSATFRDLGIRTSIDSVYLYIEPKAHVFIISVKIGRVASPVTVGDIASFEESKLRITNEYYAPKLLTLLWNTYGERVKQVSRLILELDLAEKDVANLKGLVIYDPREDLATRILDGIDRVLPEGARVRYPLSFPNRVTVIASEDAIGEEWKKKAEEIVRKVSS